MPILKFLGNYDAIVDHCSVSGTRNTEYHDSNYTDAGCWINSSKTDYVEIDWDASSHTDVWLKWHSNTWNTNACDYCTLGHAGGFAARVYRTTATNCNLQYYDGSSWTTVGGTFTTLDGTNFTERCFHVRLHATEGVIEYAENGAIKATWTGNTLQGGSTELSEARIGRVNQNIISEIVVADQAPYGCRVSSKRVTADGAETGWTGSYADVDGNDTNYASPTASATVATYVAPDAYASAPPEIPVAQVIITADTTDVAAGVDVTPVCRSGGTNHEGTGIDLTSTRTQYTHMMTTDPNTGSAWTEAGYNAAEPGVKAT